MAAADKAHKQMREQMTKPGKGTKQGRMVGVVQQRMGQEKGRNLINSPHRKIGMSRHFKAGVKLYDSMLWLNRAEKVGGSISSHSDNSSVLG